MTNVCTHILDRDPLQCLQRRRSRAQFCKCVSVCMCVCVCMLLVDVCVCACVLVCMCSSLLFVNVSLFCPLSAWLCLCISLSHSLPPSLFPSHPPSLPPSLTPSITPSLTPSLPSSISLSSRLSVCAACVPRQGIHATIHFPRHTVATISTLFSLSHPFDAESSPSLRRSKTQQGVSWVAGGWGVFKAVCVCVCVREVLLTIKKCLKVGKHNALSWVTPPLGARAPALPARGGNAKID